MLSLFVLFINSALVILLLCFVILFIFFLLFVWPSYLEWAISKTDTRKIGAFDQWCLRMLSGIKWYQFVSNDNVRRLTKQPKLIAIIQ